ncbi:hypothetical protein V491_08773 [Pseudogymnoascus sp. VKM F-3775]|nr:hypothetical protein V491_08773 [Pseudogymnoascus sp. VKM F-3775]
MRAGMTPGGKTREKDRPLDPAATTEEKEREREALIDDRRSSHVVYGPQLEDDDRGVSYGQAHTGNTNPASHRKKDLQGYISSYRVLSRKELHSPESVVGA